MVAIQIRDVPTEVRDALSERARRRGQSLQVYLFDLLMRTARQPTEEDFDRLAELRQPVDVDKVVAIIREGRDGDRR